MHPMTEIELRMRTYREQRGPAPTNARPSRVRTSRRTDDPRPRL